jgi:hypothetical protein
MMTCPMIRLDGRGHSLPGGLVFVPSEPGDVSAIKVNAPHHAPPFQAPARQAQKGTTDAMGP